MQILLINPWIYDFAAFDMWARPLGLLEMAAYLRNRGFKVHFLDCLSTSSSMPLKRRRGPVPKSYGTSKYYKEEVAKPPQYQHIQRRFSRYGIPLDLLKEQLLSMQRPKVVLVGSMMTYWYLGVQEVIRILKEIWPDVFVILGGIYARLCYEHAKRSSGADMVLTTKDPKDVEDKLNLLGIFPEDPKEMYHPYPAYDMFFQALGHDDNTKHTYSKAIAIRTTEGCPLSCSYCASKFLNPNMGSRAIQDVIEEILFWNSRYGIQDYAFYDDALLMRPDIISLLEALCSLKKDLRFHTPNGLHGRIIDKNMAELLKQAGFKTIRIGLETSRTDQTWDYDEKLKAKELERAVDALYLAGLFPKDLGAYVLVGLPGQTPKGVKQALYYAKALGLPPYLAEYSPIPHTRLWERARLESKYPLEEPLFHNNTILPCWPEPYREEFKVLKETALEIRRELTKACL